ncbi:MAG: hypothetical protein NKF70_00085 [Methanobacterium sp. ERen5]|nr:MAG: hypothetical protein NKF70_00085 [Methanobacterium sp. ERen5]
MTLELSMDDLFTSDIQLYELLKEVKDDNEILSKFFISFPSGYDIKNRQYGIFVGNARNVLDQQTSTGDSYDSSVIVLITSKQTDYQLAKVGIDLATKELIKEIRKSELTKRGFKWTESTIVYTDSLDIKYRSITFYFKEMYSWEDVDYDERDLKLIFEDVEITEGDE